MVLTTVLSMIRYVSGVEDCDFIDRLHCFFTTNLLIGLSVLISFKQFGGSPIECLTPDTFSGAWEQYAESYCFAQDTYAVPMSIVVDGMPQEERYDRRIKYYQWVPFLLLFSASCFRLPSLIWRSLSDYSGIKVKELINMALDNNNVKPEIKKANVKSISIHLQGALRFHRRLRKRHIQPHRLNCLFNPYSSCFVAIIYLTTKFALLLNVVGQLYLMNNFLATDKYQFYGWGAVVDLINGNNWERSGLFPRVTLCDLQVRTMGNIQEFTIQCVLLINLLNEKVFIFLWFWYAFLLFLTLGSCIYWLFLIICPCLNKQFIVRHLEMSELDFDPDDDAKHVNSFVYRYLRTDGLFVMRMLAFRSGVVFSTELLADLYRSYKGIDAELKRSNSDGNMTMAQYDQSEQENKKNAVRMRKRKTKLAPTGANYYDDTKQTLIQPVLTPDYFMNLQKMTQNPYNMPYHPMNLPQTREPNELPMSIDETTNIDANEHREPKKHRSASDHYVNNIQAENQHDNQNDDKTEESNV